MNSSYSGRLYQKIAEALVEMINAGEFAIGSRLPAERKLAEHFKVSRPTIREAIIALELAGYVEVKGGSGVYITSASGAEISGTALDIGPFEILEARLIFESQAAAIAAKMITDEELTTLRQALLSMELENQQVPISENADEAFHLIIAKATHNEAVVSVCLHLWNLRNSSKVSQRILEKVRHTGTRPSIEEHKRILSALERRDPAAAQQAMHDHLSRVLEQLLDTTEAEAVEEVRRKAKDERQRFSAHK